MAENKKRLKELDEDKLGAYFIYNICCSPVVKEYQGLSELVRYSKGLLPPQYLTEFLDKVEPDTAEQIINAEIPAPRKRPRRRGGRFESRMEDFDMNFDYNFLSDPQKNGHFKYILKKFFKTEPDWHEIKGFQEIKDFWELSDKEMSALLFCVANSILGGFCRVFENFSLKSRQKIIASALNFTQAQLNKVFGINGKLRRCRIVDDEYHCSENIKDFLCNGAKGFGEETVIIEKINEYYPTESFGLKDIDLEIVKSLLASKKECKILLYGLAGAGKTAFVKSLAKELNKKIYVPKKSAVFPMNFYMPARIADRQKAIAFFDEADKYLETQNGFFGQSEFNKGDINQVLDKLEGKCIFVVNSIDGIDESTRRRFSYAVAFKKIPELQKHCVITTALKKAKLDKLLSETDIQTIYDKYSLSPALLGSAVANAKTVLQKKDKEKALTLIDAFAQSHAQLRGKSQFTKKKRTHSQKFELGIINTDCDCQNIVNLLKRFNKAKQTGNVDSGMNLLFYGLAGTGKTELAKYLADELGVELIVRRMSELLSKWVGGTEQQIAQAFAEAEAKDAILLIDEADSIFTNRVSAQQNHEVSKVNEMLAQMDDYRGILICTTNMLDAFDSAAMRRFQKKIKFSALNEQGRKTMFRKYFAQEPTSELDYLDGLCAGDFRNVYDQTKFEDDLSPEYITDLLSNELKFKKEKQSEKSIGFCW